VKVTSEPLQEQGDGRGGAAAQPGTILDVSGLTVRYDTRIALVDVDFKLQRGEQVAVVGPNGAGKSTLFRAVAGLIETSAGNIRVHGHAPGVGVCVAYVKQRSDVDWSFPVSVADVVMMGRVGHIGLLRRPGDEDRALVAHALETMDLTALADRQIGELSGGQQQRMFIARALAQEAELVLMDEPLTGLDARSRANTLALMAALRHRLVSVMVATHDLELASTQFDRVMLLNHRMIGYGPPDEVFTKDALLEAYGPGVALRETEGGTRLLGDTGGHDDVGGASRD
jgi:manganese/iron transport system ATP-binding protein